MKRNDKHLIAMVQQLQTPTLMQKHTLEHQRVALAISLAAVEELLNPSLTFLILSSMRSAAVANDSEDLSPLQEKISRLL